MKIKFRAWDAGSGQMIYSDNRDKANRRVEYVFEVMEDTVICRWFEDYEGIFGEPKTNSGTLENIMRYIGVDDKNHNEVYEGDFVKVEYYNGYNKNEPHDDIDEVVWNEDGISPLDWEFECRECRSFCEISKMEIVGNIYENPELRRKEKYEQ